MNKKHFKVKNKLAITLFVLLMVVTTNTTYAASNTKRETATPITIGQAIKANFEYEKDVQYYYYKFEVPKNIGNEWITISVTNYGSRDIDLILYDSLEQKLDATYWIKKNSSASMRRSVEGTASNYSDKKLIPGNTYYIAVKTGYRNNPDYVLSLTSTIDDNWGTFEKAESLICNQEEKGVLEYKEDIDCYAITLPNDGMNHNVIIKSDQKVYALFADANGIKIDSTNVEANSTNNKIFIKGKGQKMYIRIEAGYGTKRANYSIKVLSEKKKISTLKLTQYKKNTKKIVGKTIKKAIVKVKIGKKTYTVKSNKTGKFTVKLINKLKSKNKIKVTVTKANYKTKTKTFKVK